jgi:AraC-like DNA-binding protein
MNSNIYVVRASHMQPFFHTLKKLNTDVESLLAKVGLTLSMFDCADTLIPEAPLWEFVGIAAEELNLPNFGFLVTENVCLDKYGAFGEHLCSAKNLASALELFIKDLNTHVNFPNYWLERDGDYVWLCRKGTPGIEKGKWPVEQHVISFLIELVRVYAGDEWQPHSVKLHSCELSGIEQAKSLQQSKISKGQAYGAIAIENSLMDNSTQYITQLAPSGKIKTPATLLEEVPNDLVLTLQALFHQGILQQGFFGNELDTELIASKIGVNLRTLQRRIKEQDTTLKVLIEQARYHSAKTLLLTDELSTEQVAYQLGYSDISNFMRAFKRWSGSTPKQFKRDNEA